MSTTWKWRLAQRLEIRWWKSYLNKKDVDTYLEWKRSYWQDFLTPLKKMLKAGEGVRVLDAGCGPAGIFIILNKETVTAVDPLLDAYRDEIDHFDPENYPNVHFVTSPLEAFENILENDTIFCLNAINHVADLDKALDRLVSSLKEDGKLVLSIDCHRSSFLKRLFRLIPGDALHPHQYDKAEYIAMMESRGLTVEYFQVIKPGRIFDYAVLVAGRS